VLDATAGSDAGIDVVSSEYATVAAEQTALEHLAEESPTRSSRGSRSTPARRPAAARPAADPGDAMKASKAQIDKALKAPAETRLFLFHGPTIWQPRARPGDRRGDGRRCRADRPAGADLKADPARLADEAASISMFGGARWIWSSRPATNLAAIEALHRGAGGGQPGGGRRRRAQARVQIAQARSGRANASLRLLRPRRRRRRSAGARHGADGRADRPPRRRQADRRILRRQPRPDRPGTRQIRHLCRRLAGGAAAHRP
jgi:hypothetical protein